MQDYKFSLSHVHIIQSPEENVQNPHVLTLLRQEGISSLLVEGGESIHASFIEDQLFQEIIAYIVPKWICGTTAPSFLSS